MKLNIYLLAFYIAIVNYVESFSNPLPYIPIIGPATIAIRDSLEDEMPNEFDNCAAKPPKGYACPKWFFYDSKSRKCYHIPKKTIKLTEQFTMERVTTRCNAKMYCNLIGVGSRLPVIESKEDMSFFRERVPDATYTNFYHISMEQTEAACYWLGLHRFNDTETNQLTWRWDYNRKVLTSNSMQNWTVNPRHYFENYFAYVTARWQMYKGSWDTADKVLACHIICQADVRTVDEAKRQALMLNRTIKHSEGKQVNETIREVAGSVPTSYTKEIPALWTAMFKIQLVVTLVSLVGVALLVNFAIRKSKTDDIEAGNKATKEEKTEKSEESKGTGSRKSKRKSSRASVASSVSSDANSDG